MKLSPQEKKVYEYIKAHLGCTTHDITRDTFVQKPCARIVGLEQKGVVVERRGQIKYPCTRPFEKLYIGKSTGIPRQPNVRVSNGCIRR